MTSSPTREEVEWLADAIVFGPTDCIAETVQDAAAALRALLARAEAAETTMRGAVTAAANAEAERDAARAEVARLSEALRPFAQAAQIYHDAIQNFVVEGETLTERRFSAGERADRARELASEHLASLPVEALLEARAALAGEAGRG